MARSPLTVEEREDLRPVCPHCTQQLDRLVSRRMRARLGKRFVYACPHCSALLGVSHRKGFWMG